MKIGPLEVEAKISIGGLIVGIIAVVGFIGGWYNLQYRVNDLEQDHQQELQMHEKLNDTLNTLNTHLGRLEQRMDDSHVGAQGKDPK